MDASSRCSDFDILARDHRARLTAYATTPARTADEIVHAAIVVPGGPAVSCIPHHARRRRGFTMIELLVVMTIMMLLAGLGIPVWLREKKQGDINATRTLVQAVAAAISTYGTRTWQVSVPIRGPGGTTTYESRVGHLFDLNSQDLGSDLRFLKPGDMGYDGIIDGDPVLENKIYPGSFAQALIDSGYTGFITMTQPPIGKRNVDPATKRVIDAWKHPLHIGFGSDVYGPAGFGVWSVGPNGVDEGGVGDDITSFESGQHEK